MELSDINGGGVTDTGNKGIGGSQLGRFTGGCLVRILVGLVLLFLAMLVAMGVSLVVYLNSSRDNTGSLQGSDGLPSGGMQGAVTSRQEWVTNGDTATRQICGVCPFSQTSTQETSEAPGETTTTTSPDDPQKYRLPSTLTPSHYTIRLQPHFYGSDPSTFFFEGSVTIDVICNDDTDVVTLHALNLTIEDSDVSVREKASGISVAVREISYDSETLFYRIHLASSLKKGVEYQVVMARFSGPLKDDGIGLFYTTYWDGETLIYLLASQLESTAARKVFPCFDEPGFKSTFDVTLLRRTGTARPYHTLSNTNRNRSLSSSTPGWVEDVYDTTMKMSTYLLGFVVSDFGHMTNTTKGVKYSTWAPPNAVPQVTWAHELGLKVFEFCENLFQPSYTSYLDKLDNVAVTGWLYGGMENWGMIRYGESIINKPGISTTLVQQYAAVVTAHEIVHMWFGNMVTPKWWKWLWLKEGVASFWHMQIIDEMFPQWRMTDQVISRNLYKVMTSDALASSQPMTSDVASPPQIFSMYSDITHVKGAFVVRMMHFIMGADKFIDGLNKLVQDHKEGNIEQTDLWTALNEFSLPGVDMAQKMDPWVTQMGYPVVVVSRPVKGMLHLEQRRFLIGSEDDLDPRYREAPYGYKWDIPITLTSSKDPNFNKTGADIVWMEKDRPLRTLSDPTEGDVSGWFVLNVQQYGYYRVLYDRQNWVNLIHQLNTDHELIHPINRAQLINDAWNLVRADLLDIDTALKTVEFLSKETDYLPWKAFATEFNQMKMLLDSLELYSDIETVMLNMVSGPLQQLGMDITDNLQPLQVYIRVQLAELACSHGHPTCVNLAQLQFHDWMTTGSNVINANYREHFYCTAVQRGSQAEWNFLLTKLQSERDIEEKPRICRALSCTTDPALLRRFLNMAMKSNDSQTLDFSQVITDISANRIGRDISFQFVVEHFSSLVATLGSRISGVISSVTAHFSSEYDLCLLDLLESSGNTPVVAPAIRNARTKTRANMKWLQTNLATLQNWLQREEDNKERIDYRLPSHVRPSHYQMELQPNIYGNDTSAFSFEGSVVIHIKCITATKVITLHVDRLIISGADISVKQVNSQKELFKFSSYEKLRHFLRLQLTESLQAGKQYIIKFLHFSGPLMSDGNGLYLSHYRDGQDTVYLATTQMEATYARKAFPCFDEPHLKATFDITLVRRTDTGRNYSSLTNTPYLDSQYMTDAEGHYWAKDRFERTPVMPTYLLAFVVSDFTCEPWKNKTSSDPNVTYRTCSRPNAVQWAGRAQEYGLKLFDWLNQHFKPKYSHALSKLDNVAVPDFSSGAMENWGLIIYREAILYQPGVTSAKYEHWMASVIAHEIAHMWFGNYVSPKWWNWIWLNEAFASWWEVYATKQVFPDWDMVGDWVSSSVYGVMESDAQSTSHPMTADVMTPTTINAIFDAVTYDKGAAIIRMMQVIMGFDTFVDGLNLHLESNHYGSAEAADLFKALNQKMLEQGFGRNYMTTKMDPWVSQMGYPVVMVTRTPSGYRLTQKRFLIGSAQTVDDRYKDAPYNYQWEIPVIYASSKNLNMTVSRDRIQWLSKNSDLLIPDVTVNDTEAWILLNIEQVTYCRVLYDAYTWRALIGQLNHDPSVIPSINRGQIINDAWNLAKAGLLDMSIALSTLDFLQSETTLAPWRAFAREINYMEVMLESTDLFPRLQTYMRKTLQKPLQTMTLHIEEGMPPTVVFVRTLVAECACGYGLVGCVNVAKRLFAEWKNTDSNKINANLRYQFYCTAVAEGDVTDWEFVYRQFKSVDDTTELTNLRHALSCSKDQTLIKRLLSMTLNPNEIRFQDLSSTIQFVASNPVGRDLAYQFFVDNFEHFRKSLQVLNLGRVLTYVTKHFNTDYQLRQLEQLPKIRDVSAISHILEEAITRTRSNMIWLRNNYGVIRKWLTQEERIPTHPVHGSYRLPPHLVPEHYTLSLQPHIYGKDPKQFFFEGNVTIILNCTSPTSTITLHQDRLEINRSTIMVTRVTQSGMPLEISKISEEKQFHFYHIHLQSLLTAGEQYSLQFYNFRGQMRTSGEGLYLSSYKDGNRTIYLATTQMEPINARQVFPCFDEPAMKATFNTSLIRRTDTDRHYITLSNMLTSSSEVIDKSWTKDNFQQTMKMPTYLLAFIVCDYLHLSNVSTKYPVMTRTFARPNRIQDAHTAHQYSVELFDWYNGKFKPPYETFLSKVDHIAIPDFSDGAMKNWGLITYREKLLYNSMSMAGDRSWVAKFPSYELAHMWFGNMVSPKWWTWLWLDEAFASYWESYAVEQLHPSWRAWSEVTIVAEVMSVMQTDSYSTSHPMSNYVETPKEIESQFDSIAFTKGSAIIGMMHMIMGEHFIPALNVYIKDKLLGSAEHKDLFDSLNKYIGNTADIDVNMTEKMEPWVTQMGYPVVNVHRQGSRLQLSQKRFLLGSTSPTDTGTYGYKYEVPITYTTSSEKIFNKSRNDIHWLHANGSTLDIELSPDEDWAVFNLRHQGYYRVNYDITMWKALIAQLNTDHTVFDPMNRAALMDDAFNLVKAELLPLEIALQTVNYMQKEVEYAPWRVFARETDQLEQMVERTELFPRFQRFMQVLVGKPLKMIGFDLPLDNDPPIMSFKLSWIVLEACKYDHVTCVKKATSMVSDWMNGFGNGINVNLRFTMYCTAVREGGHDVWNFIYSKYQEQQDPTEKSRLRSALGCSKDPTILNRFLDMCLYDDIVPRLETPHCISAVVFNRYGRDVAVNFVWEHFAQLKNSFSASQLGTMVDKVTRYFRNNYHLTQLQFLMDTYDVSGITGTLDMVKERTVTNMRYTERNYETIKRWLQAKSPTIKLNYRLPTSVIPTHYNLELRPDIYHANPSAFTFDGKVTIHVKIREPTSTITLHSYLLDERAIRDSARLLYDGNRTDTDLVQKVTFDVPRHFLILTLKRDLSVGEKFWIYLEFSGKLRDDGVGLYYTSYRADDGTIVYLATTKFEARYARRAFPCFDEPALKATVNTTLVRKQVYNGRFYRAWSNNELLRTESRDNEYWADIFRETPITSTYLLAFIVADFSCLTSSTKQSLTYSTCAQPDVYLHAQLAQDWGVREMEWLEDHFNPDYSMAKLDNMAIPNFFLYGAMENWGLITYKEAILYQEGITTARNKSWTVEVVAHELTHMWFGNIVSPQWWNWLWLNEAFASFWDFTVVDILEPAWRHTDQFVVQSLHSVMSLDSLTSSHPLSADVESPSEIESLFDSVAYSKGAAIVRMMHFIMGEDDFIAALNVYLHDNQYSAANHTHLFDALDKYLIKQSQSLRMKEVMEPWVTQMNYPVVNVQWTAMGQVTLTQKCFLASGQAASAVGAPFGYTWDIPITMATSSSPNQSVTKDNIIWFKRTDTQMTINSSNIPPPPTLLDTSRWLLLNVRQYGYYRVNYTEANWRALIEHLKLNTQDIHAINRAQIINDAWSIARSGQLDMSIAFETLKVLKNDNDYAPWHAMSGELAYLDLMLSRKDIYGLFQDYMLELMETAYNSTGMNSNSSDPPIQIIQQQRIAEYACKYGAGNCRTEAIQRFNNWKSNPQANKLEVDLRGIVLCNGVCQGTRADWDFVYERYRNTTSRSEQKDLLSSLSCSREDWLLHRLMDLTLNSSVIMAQDVPFVLESVSANPIGRDMAFNFLKQYFNELSRLMTNGSFGDMVVALTRHFNTHHQLDEVKQFMAQYDVSIAQSSFRQVVVQTSVNIQWMKDYYQKILQFLQDRNNW